MPRILVPLSTVIFAMIIVSLMEASATRSKLTLKQDNLRKNELFLKSLLLKRKLESRRSLPSEYKKYNKILSFPHRRQRRRAHSALSNDTRGSKEHGNSMLLRDLFGDAPIMKSAKSHRKFKAESIPRSERANENGNEKAADKTPKVSPDIEKLISLASSRIINITGRLETLLNDYENLKLSDIKRENSENTTQALNTTDNTNNNASKPQNFPCNLAGSWISQAAGMRIDIQSEGNSVAKIGLGERVPNKRLHEGFMEDIDWEMTGYVPFPKWGMIILTGIHKEDDHVAAFIGECQSCGDSDTVSGQWLLSRPSRDCRDEKLAQKVVGDLWTRENLHTLMQEEGKGSSGSGRTICNEVTSSNSNGGVGSSSTLGGTT